MAIRFRDPRSRAFSVLAALFLLLAVANAGLYFSRDKRDVYVPATYKALYVPVEAPLLSRMRIPDRGRVELGIEMPSPPAAWTISDDTGETYESRGRFPVLALRPQKHHYTVTPAGGPLPARTFHFQFGYYSSEYYRQGGRTQKDNNWLVSADIPVGRFARRPLAFWAGDYGDLDPSDITEAKRLLRDEAGITPGDGDIVKIEKLAAWLIGAWSAGRGTPDDAIEAERSPLRVFQRVAAGRGKIWCSQHAKIYGFFANLAGLPTRLISLAGRIDNVITTGHAFAESYLADSGTWAKVDTSLNKLLVLNSAGRPLNSAEVYQAIVAGHLEGLTVRALSEGVIVSEPYTDGDGGDAFYFTPGANLVYHPARARTQSALAGYLFQPEYAYSLDASLQGGHYARRRVLFALWALSAILAVGAWVGRSRRDRRG
jgi:hypothetical protein